MFGQPDTRVLILGDGIGASVLACLLRDAGFGVVLLARTRRRVLPPIIEALPEATVGLLAEAGLTSALHGAGAVIVDGFENATRDDVHTLDGRWVHVDRHRLAEQCRAAARRRGALTLHYSRDLGHPGARQSGVGICVDGSELTGFAAVDASGRAARWSRPVRRGFPLHATLWHGPPPASARPGRLARREGGWAYRLEHPTGATVGLLDLSARADAHSLSAEVAERLSLEDVGQFSRVASCASTVQWACEPVGHRRLAIGDAAVAYSPIAGQGLRLTTGSAFAATAVLRTWVDGDRDLADAYYLEFIDSARRRHLATLARAADESADTASAPIVHDGRQLYFVAAVTTVGMNIDGRIVPREGLVLPDGSSVRWVGSFDALNLRDAIGIGATAHDAVQALIGRGHSRSRACLMLEWGMRAGVVSTRTSVL